ncbi:MAG TPA: hypothetical protein DCM48_13835, partial [Thalassospira sp.]|nr:hypothetical protein [Thalassospira sp.]
MNQGWQNLQLSPLLDITILQGLAILCLVAVIVFTLFRLRGTVWRAVVMVLVLLTLLAPQFTDQESEQLSDIVLVLVDRSASQNIADRAAQTDAAIAELQDRFADDPSVELRFEDVPGETDTRMFAVLDRLLGGLPRERLGGVMMITDGQVHDVPDRLDLNAPLHVLISGGRDERDRRLVIRQSADYGIVGKDAEFMIEAVDPQLPPGTAIPVRMLFEDGTEREIALPANEQHRVSIPVPHAGSVLAELRMDTFDEETDKTNNRLILETTGVR